MNRLQEIETRLASIAKELDAPDSDIDKLTGEVTSLQEERKGIMDKAEKRKALLSNIAAGKSGVVTRTFTEGDLAEMSPEEIRGTEEYRSAFFKRFLNKPLNAAEERTMTSAGTSAGAAIPTSTAEELIKKLKQVAPLLNEVTLLRVAGNVTFAVENTRDEAANHAEGTAITPAADSIAKVQLGGYEITKVIRISKTVQTMAVNSFESWLVDILTEDISRKIEKYLVNGTGTSEPQGVATAATWDATNSVSVAAASSLTYTNVATLIGLLPGGYDYNAKFLMSKKTLFTDFMPLKDDSKYNIVIRENGTYTILGYPVMLSESVAEHDAYLGDFKKIVANLAQDITVESNTSSGFTANAIDFLGCAIFDSKVAVGEAFVKLTKAQA